MKSLKSSLICLGAVAILLGLPTAHALEVRICAPFVVPAIDCLVLQSATSQTVPQPPDPNTGLSTTTFPLVNADGTSPIRYGPFTITATVTAQQSGTLQKITFNPTTVTANLGAGCSLGPTATNPTAPDNPCQLQIIATSDLVDFPFNKPVGGYPAGVFMAGGFTGTEPRHQSPPNPNGDTISMTGEASALSVPIEGPVKPLNNAVINATPGTGTGDTPTSLPSTCTGATTCKFIATGSVKSFNSQIQETVQQVCDVDPDGVQLPDCPTRLRTTLNVNIKTAGNSVSLPAGMVTVTPPKRGDPPINLLPVLIAETLPQLASFDVQKLLVGRNDFALTAQLKLSSIETINPAKEEVFMRVGDFNLTFPAGKFVRLLDGKLYSFVGKIGGIDIAAAFARDLRDVTSWTFVAGVHGVQLRPLLPPAPDLAPVDISVGGDTGSDLVAPSFF